MSKKTQTKIPSAMEILVATIEDLEDRLMRLEIDDDNDFEADIEDLQERVRTQEFRLDQLVIQRAKDRQKGIDQ